MGETIQKVRNQLTEFWQKTDKKKKIKIGISALLVILGIVILVLIFTRTKYEVLYDDLSLKDLGEVTKKLDELNIEWKTGDKETTILVPKGMKNKVKIELASYGLPKEGYNFTDAFNDSSWTMTEYEKKERMKYALQNELASTISEIDGVESATVYIDEKEDSGFVVEDNKQETTASVFLKKSDSTPLSQEKITAIKNLVAGSVNMNPENVSLVDDQGQLLDEENGQSSDTSDQYAIQQNLENKTNESIRNFLENMFGYGNVDVRSSFKINFDVENSKITEFSPPVEGSEEGLVRSMEEIEQNMVGDEAEGVPGTEENPPDYQMPEDQNGKYNKASRTINYELNEINKEIRKTPGQVEGVTVAVLINKNALSSGEMTEEKKNEISKLVYAATGIDTKQVQVSAENFSSGSDNTELNKGNSHLLLWLIIGALAAAGAGGFLIYRKRKQKEEEMELDELEEENELEKEDTEVKPSEEIDFDKKESDMKTQIDKFIEKKPDAVAQLLRTWLNE